MTRFWWVRHAPTHEKTFVGWRDVPGDVSDGAALQRVSDHLPEEALLIASDLQRASVTADAIQAGRARLPDDPRLREFNFGDWDGLPFDEIAEGDPALSRAYWETPGDIRPPGGESWNDAALRVQRCVDDLLADHAGRDIIVVAHIGIIMTQIARATGAAPEDAIGHRIDNLSVTETRYDGAWSVGRINHLV